MFKRNLARGFVAALAIRWSYVLAVFAMMGEEGLKGGPDSETYTDIARRLGNAILSGSVQGWDWFGPHTAVMPLYSLYVAAIHIVFGDHSALAYALIQSVIDSGTCLLVYLIAKQINPIYAAPAMIAAIVNPTQIVMSGLIYPDTLFVFFVALSLLGTVRWLSTASVSNSVLLAIGLSCAALIRILIAPWAGALIIFLACVQIWRAIWSARILAQLLFVSVIFAISIGSILARNVVVYRTWSLTSQGGLHLVTVVPWVRQSYDGTPWTKGYEELRAAHDRRFPTPAKDLFQESRNYAEVANEEWRSLGLTATVKAWAYGATINLASPAIILSPPVAQIPRTGFYQTPGSSMPEKIAHFLLHSESAIYVWILLFGGLGVAVIRIIQLTGAIVLLREGLHISPANLPVAALFMLWLCFILAVNGPVASPKYRLPLEPIFNVLTAIGFVRVYERICQTRRRKP